MKGDTLLDLAVVILALAVGACLVIAFIGGIINDEPVNGSVGYLVFTALGGVIGILASRLSQKHKDDASG